MPAEAALLGMLQSPMSRVSSSPVLRMAISSVVVLLGIAQALFCSDPGLVMDSTESKTAP
eukprot:CAMPEP_0178892576 /NCGR_PEP_ID=MMETSP0747-20121128/19559_1 /TAXON_ID=913974 /ORGANISM="Nitzschia punctata, Strain CCMP561" /LENGTH=59 /DNA_ID=CAMNT_0020562523 /DNA_START=31 /DNA_END=207 /DNA_ORIENTATION=+